MFLLIDESHRGQYGEMHTRMKRMFPNACYLGFTGTPLLKKEKNTLSTFGGLTHLYLGRQYKLKVRSHVQQQVKLFRGCLVVQSHKPKDRELTRELVENWYRERAHLKLKERLHHCRQLFPRPDDFHPAGLVIRKLKQRWGSMTADRKLILNRWLVRASVDAIDYVITHELCHIQHNHHGPEFYKLLDRVMPDWQKRKSKLERQMA